MRRFTQLIGSYNVYIKFIVFLFYFILWNRCLIFFTKLSILFFIIFLFGESTSIILHVIRKDKMQIVRKNIIRTMDFICTL